jgi:spermidine synthase
VSILIAAGAAVAAYVLARSVGGYALSIAVLLLVAFVVPANATLFQERTFFGVNRVYADKANDGRHVLMNGTTVHGMEAFSGPDAHQPTTYYAPSGPIGQYFAQLDADARPHEIGVVGLGSGALAAYGRPGDHFTYYEIDPAVIDIAEDRDLFTFVPDSKAKVDMVLGDGRIELEQRADARYDLLTVDAFSGDAIPVHLITDEALSLYLQRLAPHGVLAFHISNRYFDFAPVLARLAAQHGLTGIIQDNPATPDEAAAGKLEATWVLLARTPADLGVAAHDPRWQPLGSGAGAPLWTDSYSDLLHVFRWQGS